MAASACSEEALITSNSRQFVACSSGLSSDCQYAPFGWVYLGVPTPTLPYFSIATSVWKVPVGPAWRLMAGLRGLPAIEAVLWLVASGGPWISNAPNLYRYSRAMQVFNKQHHKKTSTSLGLVSAMLKWRAVVTKSLNLSDKFKLPVARTFFQHQTDHQQFPYPEKRQSLKIKC